MQFTKMQGNGNDFIIIEDLSNKFKGKEKELALKICNRRFGIGADGILLVRKSNIFDIEMEIINSDGSYAAMCGNGIRCFAKYIYEEGIVEKEDFDILTGDGVKKVFLDIDKNNKVKMIKVNMGDYNFNPESIPALSDKEIVEKEYNINGKLYRLNSLLMTIPHTVILEEQETPIEEGEYIEKYNIFPNKTNVNFCKVLNEDSIRVRTWERGAGATLGCGTGNCAAAVVANKLGYVGEKVKVIVPGGELLVHIQNNKVSMIGDAKYICKGDYFFERNINE